VGAFALLIHCDRTPNVFYATQRGSALFIVSRRTSYGEAAAMTLVVSDLSALKEDQEGEVENSSDGEEEGSVRRIEDNEIHVVRAPHEHEDDRRSVVKVRERSAVVTTKND